MNSQSGFTLIELMIVIVIIGVLAMFAIPKFSDHTISAQVSRVTMESSALRTAVDVCLAQGSSRDDCQLGLVESDLLAQNSEQKRYPTVEFTQGDTLATITSTFGGNASSSLQGSPAKTVTWTLDKNAGWQCTTTVDEKYAAKGCKAAQSSSQ